MTEPYRIRSADTWARARDDYLAGMAAETVCSRHDLGLSAFRRHARRGGWRRVDLDDAAPVETDLTIYEDIDLDEQVVLARLRFVQALHHGRAWEAARWRRLWHELHREKDAFDADFLAGMSPEEIDALLIAEAAELEAEDEDLDPLPPEPEPAPAGPGNGRPDVHGGLSGEPRKSPLRLTRPENVHDVHPDGSSGLSGAAGAPPPDLSPASAGP